MSIERNYSIQLRKALSAVILSAAKNLLPRLLLRLHVDSSPSCLRATAHALRMTGKAAHAPIVSTSLLLAHLIIMRYTLPIKHRKEVSRVVVQKNKNAVKLPRHPRPMV